MKPLLLLFLIPFACFGQKSAKEAFLNDVLQSGLFHSVNDKDPTTCVIDTQCSSRHISTNNLSRYLPDSISQEMKKQAIKDTACYWNVKAIHRVHSKTLSFLNSNALDLIMDRYTRYDSTGSQWHKDSIANRLKLINATRKKYNNPTGYYSFNYPIFDKSQQYAVFSHSYFCNFGFLCGDGSCDLYHKEHNHWKKIATLYSINY